MKKLLILIILIPLLLMNNTFHANTSMTIKHVIIIIEENHSFDNLFGTYPFGYPPIINNITLSVMWPDGLYDNYIQLENTKNGVLDWISVPTIPWLPLSYSHSYYANAYDTVDPSEGWTVYHGDYWLGKPIGFVFYSGTQSMAYFSYQQAGILWDYAEEYTLADAYFSPVLGLTEPNRVAYLTGFPPDFFSDEAYNVVPFNETIMYQLEKGNISWGYFVYNINGIPWPLTAFTGINMTYIYDLSVFFKDLDNGSLPAVSWVMFLGGNSDKYDMHPPYNVTASEMELVKVINAVMESKSWNSSVIFITFDEGGGYYDHIAPPAINYYGLGQRVPLFIISPYAKEGYVDNYTISGYTLLAFIDYNWHLPWLTKYVENSDLQGLLQAFNFSSKPRSPIILSPSNWTYPIPLQNPIHYGYIAVVTNDYKSYTTVYPAPSLQYLLPLEIVGIILIIVRKKLLTPIGLIVLLIVLGISTYYYTFYNLYSFIAEFYLYSSLIGVIGGTALLVRGRKK